jgi:hypothetical protein
MLERAYIHTHVYLYIYISWVGSWKKSGNYDWRHPWIYRIFKRLIASKHGYDTII